MTKKLAIFFVLFLANWSIALKLPSTFNKCDVRKNNFNHCLSEAIQNAIKQLDKPLDEFGLPSLEPYQTPKDTIAAYGNATSGIAQMYSNFNISGLTKISNTNAILDFDTKTLSLDINFHKVRFDFDYIALGRVVLLPIVVSTKGAFVFKEPTFKMVFNLKQYEKENKKYFKAIDSRLKMKPQKILFEYDHILQNKIVDDALNAGMNENWDNILDFFEMMFPKIWIELFEKMFNNVLEKVPTTDFFDGLD